MGSVLLSTIDPLEYYFMAPIFGFLLLGLTTLNANAAEPRFAARIVPVTRPVIAGLSWKKKEPDLLVRGKGAKRKIYALLRGRYTGRGELIHRNWSIPLSPKGDFAFRVRLASKETPVKFIARDEAYK